MNYPTNSPKLFAAAVSQWLLVLPAALLLAAAALRQLQPARYEPARTISAMLVWILPSISHSVAALLFVGLPAIALIVGCMTLLRSWHRSGTLRQDAGAALASFGGIWRSWCLERARCWLAPFWPRFSSTSSRTES